MNLKKQVVASAAGVVEPDQQDQQSCAVGAMSSNAINSGEVAYVS